ncbi:membrane protein insertion efficiency factor YidD [Gordonia soli]|uniref:Putative membrane protein insertion efficiency factor n=1 Tax=Gordonia soli NBRC 108243 TaxID=1223545 RepID=M0QE94_9ACTN|nr:membrane protein insertion efficiency factor YidD [Gordonia soli]GAC66769.1 putative membrane protein insertion efficiency factor [Gordonia soli NBRC 108243]
MTTTPSDRTSTAGHLLYLLPRRSVVFLIELYRTWVSPMRLPTCRFEPTCSAYAVEALTVHGFFRGGLLSVYRLLKCGPWHKPGYDPVPERRGSAEHPENVISEAPTDGSSVAVVGETRTESLCTDSSKG